MITRSSGPFEGLVTQYKDKLRTDPFFAARLKIAALYFVCGVFIYITVDFFIDASLRDSFYLVASLPQGSPVDESFRALKINLWLGRALKLVLFAIAAYFLAGLAMRPIKRSAEMQKRFIATVSHELRTPLAVAKNTAEVALRSEQTLTREKAVGVIKSSLEEMNRISDIIQFLLTFSNLEHRKESFTQQRVSLGEVATRAITMVRKNMPQAEVHIDLVVHGADMVSGSATALEELMLNLIKNAVTYTASGKQVRVSIREHESGDVALHVADEGVGIAEEDMPNLFEPFFQGRYTPEHQTHGIGLGLSIVKEIVALHDATLEVTSVPGKGSTFSVVFPVSESSARGA